MTIEIDHDGYPTEASIEELRRCTNVLEALEAVAVYFGSCGYGSVTKLGRVYRLATGGWSGCEEVMGSLHPIVRAVAWESSHRGGLHVFEVPSWVEL